MQRVTLSFPSIFAVSEFKSQANVLKAEVKVNLLIGELTQGQINLALNNYKAKILDGHRTNELLN